MAPTLPPAPSFDTNVGNSLPGFSLPVYFVDDAAPTAAPAAPTATPWPTVVLYPTVTVKPPASPAYQVTGRYEQKAVMTPAGWELCARFGIDLYGTPLYFGSNDAVAQWFYGGGMEHRLRVSEACGRG